MKKILTLLFIFYNFAFSNSLGLSQKDIVILRAHGSTKEVYEKLLTQGVSIFDAACIFVKRIRNLLLQKLSEGYEIIFIGDKEHPEVKGIITDKIPFAVSFCEAF